MDAYDCACLHTYIRGCDRCARLLPAPADLALAFGFPILPDVVSSGPRVASNSRRIKLQYSSSTRSSPFGGQSLKRCPHIFRGYWSGLIDSDGGSLRQLELLPN